MTVDKLLSQSRLVTTVPPGAVNVCVGAAIEGPGGRWVPCVAAVSEGVFVASVFEVGPGRRQVCSADLSTHDRDDAFLAARRLATTAAG